MKTLERLFAEKLLKIKAIKLQPANPFTWASGWKSPFYCDNRKTLSYPSLRSFVKIEITRLILERFGQVDAIAGVATGAIPQGALVADALNLPFVYVRSTPKDHGLEYVMKDLTSKAGLSEQFEIASAATSAWEIGNPVYPPARQKLAEHGIDCNGKTARQMTRLDYARYDHLIGMDESNLCDILRLVGGDPQHKVSLLMAHTDHPREVADPWFTGDFEATWQDILEGCTALLEELR